MGLQFVIGGAGTGKSCYTYDFIIREASAHPDVFYYILVPEQFTLRTQKTVVEMTPGKGILNIDVLSFQRLAYRVMEESGGDERELLEDTGKSMVLRKIAQNREKDLPFLGSQIKKPGCLDEVKSLISEFMQYDVGADELGEMIQAAGEESLLSLKLKDIKLLYEEFRSYLEDHFMTGEEVMDVLAALVPASPLLKDSVLVLDGFTGFTPIQNRVIRELLRVCRKVLVTVTMDAGEKLSDNGNPFHLFSMSRKMIRTLMEMTGEREKPVLLTHSDKTRFKDAPALRFLEENLFRYGKKIFRSPEEEGEQRPLEPGISLFASQSPLQEVQETARRIRRLVRERGLQYGEIAVITGNLEEYKELCREAFKNAGIPCFIDETHSLLMNPFVEFLLSSLEMAQSRFTFDSVFRYLRCGLSGISREETDLLENYAFEMGIRGRKGWEERWLRPAKGMKEPELIRLDELRARFYEEVGTFSEGFSSGKKTVRAFSGILYDFIEKCGIQKKLGESEQRFAAKGELSLQKEYAGIYAAVMSLLDRMVEILGDETITAREYIQLLETGLSKAKVALIPPGQDQLLVGDMQRTRVRDVKALFFIGVNEGNIPKSTQGGGLLSDMDREFFASRNVELAPDAREQMSIQRFYLYLNLTRPSEYLSLSWPVTNRKGEALSRASLINTLLALYPDLSVETEEDSLPETEEEGLLLLADGFAAKAYRDPDPLFAELYSWYLSRPEYRERAGALSKAAFAQRPEGLIGREVARVLYRDALPNNATRLEQYAACAFAHYAAYGLKLKKREGYAFRPSSFGTILHKALERFAQNLGRDGRAWRDLDEEEREAYVNQSLKESLSEYELSLLEDNARNAYMYRRMRRILSRMVWSVQKQLQEGEFEPGLIETSVEGGRIDRVDILREAGKLYVKVIDYKTGNTKFDLWAVFQGLQLQLVIYMNAVLDRLGERDASVKVIPAGIFYSPVKDPMVAGDKPENRLDPEKEIQKLLKYSGLALKDTDVLKKMDRTLVSLPVELVSGGEAIGKRSSVADEKQFSLLGSYVRDMTGHLNEEALSGNAGVLPYRRKDRTPCEYCDFRTVCGFDLKIPGYAYRDLPELSAEEIWKRMEEAGADGTGNPDGGKPEDADGKNKDRSGKMLLGGSSKKGGDER